MYIVCFTCCSHTLVILAPFLTYHKIVIECNMTGALSGAGTAYPYELTPGNLVGFVMLSDY
jgi:hypothetical protein